MDANKQIRYSHYQISDKVQHGGLMDPEQCKQLAVKVMQLYDSNGDGYVDSFEIGYMLSDCYRAMNKGFNPTPTDVASYARVLDRNGSGRIHLEDIEKMCLKYFGGQIGQGGGPGGNGQLPSSSYQQSTTFSQQYRSEHKLSAKPQLNRIVQERLDVARRIFRMVDSENSGYITEDEVPELLKETYKQMGMNHNPTEEDVQIWIKMTDTDGDGRVTLEDYEALVLKSLKQQGISLD